MKVKHDIAYYYPTGHQSHYEYGHPERPERVETIRQALTEAGLWEAGLHVAPQAISHDLLESIHNPGYLRALDYACRQGMHLDMDTYTTPQSWGLALETVGGSVSVADSVWKRQAGRGFALSRPPGHHATAERGMGFCLLNNVSLAAEYLIRKNGARRLAIIDTDLHHGNGTQDIFWERGDVFYISTHQHPLYPGSGSLDERGESAGEGATANFPLPPGSGDQAFTTIFDELILPLLDRYQPEMLLVSFGFDPHWRDPLGHLQLSARGYGDQMAKLTRWADKNSQGRIALFLEGGYDLEAASACSIAVVSALLGLEWSDPLGPAPRPEGASWRIITDRARRLWSL